MDRLSPPDPDPGEDPSKPDTVPPETGFDPGGVPLPLEAGEPARTRRSILGSGLWLAAWAMLTWMLATIAAYSVLPAHGPVSKLAASLAGQAAGIAAGLSGLRLLQSLSDGRSLGIALDGDVWAKVTQGLRVYLTSLPGLFLVTVVAAGLEKWLHFPAIRPEIQDLFSEIRGHPREVLLFFAVAAAGAPLFEELVFRGLIYGSLRSRWRAPMSNAVTAFVFAAMHEPAGIFHDPRAFPLSIFYIGLVLGHVRERTGSIYPGMAVHAVNNGMALLVALTARGPI